MKINIQNMDNFIRWRGKNHVFVFIRPTRDVLEHLYKYYFNPEYGNEFLIEHWAREYDKWIQEVEVFNNDYKVNFSYVKIQE